ncbi:MAG: antibiotic biosynthesis monooxygenase [Haloarculaceae archaeon]
MFVVANRFAVAEGQGEAFVERFADSMGDVADQPGFVRFDLLAPADDRDTYVAQTYWESEADFERWTDSASFHEAHADSPPREMFTDHPTLETYETAVSRE